MLNKNDLNFWIKPILVIVAVIIGTIAFLSYVPQEGPSGEVASDKAKERSSSGVSEGMSRFYSEFRQSSPDPIEAAYGEYTILLKDNNNKALGDAILDSTNRNFLPLDDFNGEFKQRAFASDSTLMTEASAHAEKEGFNLVWDLNQDFIIRKRFISDNTLVGMLEEISGAVDSHFQNDINIYYCFKKRALVITERKSEFLRLNCDLASIPE